MRQQGRSGRLEDLQGLRDQIVIFALRYPGPTDHQGDWPDPLLGVWLDLLLGLEHRHRPMADEIVEHSQGAVDDPLDLVPGATLPQYSFAHPAQEEGLKQRLCGLVKQQIALMLAIGGQRVLKDQTEDGTGLVDLPKRVGAAVQPVQGRVEHLASGTPGGFMYNPFR